MPDYERLARATHTLIKDIKNGNPVAIAIESGEPTVIRVGGGGGGGVDVQTKPDAISVPYPSPKRTQKGTIFYAVQGQIFSEDGNRLLTCSRKNGGGLT